MKFIITLLIVQLSILNCLSQTAEEHVNFGNLKYEENNYKGALGDFNKAISLKKNYGDAYFYRGLVKIQLKDNIGALLDFNKAIEINPNDAILYFDRGLIKSELKNFKAALLDYNKAIELNSEVGDFYRDRGRTKSKLEDYEGSILDYDKAIEFLPNDENIYYYRGLSLHALKDYDGAILDYGKGLEINSNNADLYFQRGVSRRSKEDYDGAIEDYDKALELNPNYSIASFFKSITLDDIKEKKWVYVTESTDGDKWYFNSTNLSKYQSTIKIWVRIKCKKASLNKKGKVVNYINVKKLELWEVDCSDSKIRQTSQVWYDSNGKTIFNSNDESEFENVIPDSIGEKLLEEICKYFN